MSPPRGRFTFRHRHKAFTVLEMMIYTSILMSLTVIGFKSMWVFTEHRKLRAAAIELSGYLEIARNVAFASNTPCMIAISKADGGVFIPDASQPSNSCNEKSIVPSFNLRNLSGSRNLTVQVLPGAGSYPVVFNPEGTTQDGVTVLITSTDVEAGGWCVDVQSPLATVRRGWRAKGTNECNYAIEQ
jgi:Tfp pilus assembly protein FimT